MSKEIEVRFKLNDKARNKVLELCTITKEKYNTIDIVCGLEGFDSLDKLGYIVRIREKNGKTYIENKKRMNDGSFNESKIYLNNIEEGLSFLTNMNFNPYLIIDRTRTELKYNNLIIMIDDINLLGSFIEIEYQDSNIEEVNEFIKLIGIENNPEKLYGDIFKEKMNDSNFKEKFDKKIERILKK